MRRAGYLPEMLDTIDRFRQQEQEAPSHCTAPDSEGKSKCGGQGERDGARVLLVKSSIEPYSFHGNRNVFNNWNIASMNLAAAEALAGQSYNPDGTVAASTVQDFPFSALCSPCTRSLAPVRQRLTL